ncbi:MAG TPA: DUF4743 domain-containing protein [Magnetospirillaceae bacterium]
MKTPLVPPRRLLDHILRCNTRDDTRFRPFLIAGHKAGTVRDDVVTMLAEWRDVFEIDAQAVRLAPRFATVEERTAVLRDVTKGLVERKLIAKLRSENYRIVENWGDEPLALLDRSAVAVFGIKAFGIHINGYTRRGDQMLLWIGRRALDKAVEPGKLDNMVAGGQPAGLSLIDNLIKEAEEEASIARDVALRTTQAGAITYCMEDERGLKPDTMFVYDLELPNGFTPRPNDDEITEFMLMTPDEVIERMRTSYDFKFNVNLVLIDFLIRTGFIRPENEPDYLALVAGLHPSI